MKDVWKLNVTLKMPRCINNYEILNEFRRKKMKELEN